MNRGRFEVCSLGVGGGVVGVEEAIQGEAERGVRNDGSPRGFRGRRLDPKYSQHHPDSEEAQQTYWVVHMIGLSSVCMNSEGQQVHSIVEPGEVDGGSDRVHAREDQERGGAGSTAQELQPTHLNIVYMSLRGARA